MLFIATAITEMSTPFTGGQGVSLWQTAGGLILVFGLLVVSLKFLGKFQRRSGQNNASLLTVWNLGPRREIQVLRLGEEVHYIYRHDGAMVPLKQTTFSAWEASSPQNVDTKKVHINFLGNIFKSSSLLGKARTEILPE